MNQYFNDSTGEGDHGEIDATGPWNEGADLEIVQSPALHGVNGKSDGARIELEASGESDAEAIRELLVDQMRDLLHAEKQLMKALPKMAKAANSQDSGAHCSKRTLLKPKDKLSVSMRVSSSSMPRRGRRRAKA